MPRKFTIRALAESLKLAPSTVSDALAGKGRVGAGTIKRVRELAQKHGYRPNPLMATVLSEIRRTKRSSCSGTIAALDIHEATHWPHGPFPRQVVAGIRERAQEMGFSVEEFVAGSPEMSLQRVDTILKARGIHGIIILPSWTGPDLTRLDWSRYAGLYADSVTTTPVLHSVGPDHYSSMMNLLELLAGRGYRRPGLIIEHGRDVRIQHRQTSAFRAFQLSQAWMDPVPVLITPGYPDVRREVGPWLKRHQPDVVLSHFQETVDWIAMSPRGGLKKHGFVLLNVIERSVPCAALDLQPRVLGARAAELIVGQILRNELGAPQWPSRSMIPASWVEGPTVRPATNP